MRPKTSYKTLPFSNKSCPLHLLQEAFPGCLCSALIPSFLCSPLPVSHQCLHARIIYCTGAGAGCGIEISEGPPCSQGRSLPAVQVRLEDSIAEGWGLSLPGLPD